MSTSGTEEDLARVTIISPTRRVDLALPGSVTLGELLPSIVQFAGFEASNTTDAVHNWVLQRVGEDPLDANAIVSKLSINDGETLHLRQREAAMPDAAFDDVVDAVTTATAKRPSWKPRHSQRLSLAVLLLMLVGMPLTLLVRPWDEQTLKMVSRTLTPLTRWTTTVLAGGALFFSFTSVIAAIAISRAAGEYRVASAFSWASVALALIGGYSVLPASQPLALRLTIAGSVVLLAAAVCALAARVQVMGMFTMAVTSALMIATSSAIVLMPDQAVSICAVVAALMVAITSTLPSLSYRLARIALPAVPPDAQAMLADETPVQPDIVSRALLADQLVASFLVATSLTAMCNAIVLILDHSLFKLLLCSVIGIALMLRARAFVGLQQRLGLLLAGIVISMMAAVMLLERLNPSLQIAITLLIAVILVVTLAFYATTLYNKIPNPVWGRFGDIFEWLSILSIVPLLLAVLNAYDYFRGVIG